MIQCFRAWMFTPKGALVYFGVAYSLLALGFWLYR